MSDQTAKWEANRPYNGLPPLPPLSDVETRAVLKKCAEARAAIGELKQAALRIPNQSILTSTLPMLEARTSSEIENIVTSSDRLFRSLGDELHADPATKEALRYGRALFEGFISLNEQPLSTRTAEQICSTIKGTNMVVRKTPGTKLISTASGETIYPPPEGESLLRDLLANWEQFIHGNTHLDPLIRLCIAHYQFEAIHPFTDGNGRTGRVINSLFLIQEGLLTMPVLYLSRYIIASRADYYRLLQDVTSKQAWEPWLIYLLTGIHETANWTTSKITAISDLAAHTAEYTRLKKPKIYSRELVDLIFRLPYCRISDLTAHGIAKRQTASVYLKQLVQIGILAEVETKKEKLFLHPKFFALLTEDSNEFVRYNLPNYGEQ